MIKNTFRSAAIERIAKAYSHKGQARISAIAARATDPGLSDRERIKAFAELAEACMENPATSGFGYPDEVALAMTADELIQAVVQHCDKEALAEFARRVIAATFCKGAAHVG